MPLLQDCSITLTMTISFPEELPGILLSRRFDINGVMHYQTLSGHTADLLIALRHYLPAYKKSVTSLLQNLDISYDDFCRHTFYMTGLSNILKTDEDFQRRIRNTGPDTAGFQQAAVQCWKLILRITYSELTGDNVLAEENDKVLQQEKQGYIPENLSINFTLYCRFLRILFRRAGLQDIVKRSSLPPGRITMPRRKLFVPGSQAGSPAVCRRIRKRRQTCCTDASNIVTMQPDGR